jgi:hypothetical protein
MNSVIVGHEPHEFLLLIAGNIGLEAIHKWVTAIQPIFSSLVSLGQAAVAVATVIYIVRKTHLLGKHKKTK